jgi:hypothetical protein
VVPETRNQLTINGSPIMLHADLSKRPLSIWQPIGAYLPGIRRSGSGWHGISGRNWRYPLPIGLPCWRKTPSTRSKSCSYVEGWVPRFGRIIRIVQRRRHIAAELRRIARRVDRARAALYKLLCPPFVV